VRERAQSRRRGYSKTALAAALNEAGIQYKHLRALGTPPSIRTPYKLDHDFAVLRRGYLAHLATQQEALDELAELARQAHVCLLCYEAEPGACHRSLITDRLQELGQLDGVQHLNVGA
jgi:uncharacterized protein (DUF488 family)